MIAPEVGGGFGSKLQVYGEEVLACWASRKLDRPIKWIETRSENMAVTHQGRDQIAYTKMGAKRDGTITAFHVKIIADFGAYNMLLTPLIPSLGAFVMGGCYAIPAVQTDIVGVFTNKCPTDAIRGAGRPEATHMIEVNLDQVAAELGIDPLEIRRKNFIPKESFPAATATGVVYDSGDYDKTLERLLEHVDMPAFRREQEELRAQGDLPRNRVLHLHRDLRPGAVPGHRPGGRRRAGRRLGVGDGPRPQHGRGHRLHRLLGSWPGTRDDVRADRRRPARRRPIGGRGHPRRHRQSGLRAATRTARARSRSGARRSPSAANKVADKAKAIVAHHLEAAPEDIEVPRRQVLGQGFAGQGDDARRGRRRHLCLRHPRRDGARASRRPRSMTRRTSCSRSARMRASSTSTAETGKAKVTRYVAVDDCGNAINPLLIDGQIHGGIVHAIGQALYERVHYDEDGQLVTGTFVDYALPTAAELPSFELDRTVTPSPVNSLGVKGVGEAGTIAASAAVTNAVIDALRPLGVTYINMPLSPMRVWEAIDEAQKGGVPA